MDQLLDLALEQAVGRDPRPLRDDGGDVVLVDLLLDHRGRLRLLALRELAFELRQEAVADLGDASQLAVPLGALGLHAQLVDLPRDLLDAVEQVLLACPAACSFARRAFASASSRSSGSRVAGDSFAIAASSISSCVTRRSASSSSTGDESISIRRRDADSSTRSIALSGRKRSAM